MLKIGIDFHGVLEKNTVYFADFCRRVCDKGWELHVISGGPAAKVREYMNNHNIPYTHIFAIFDACEKKGAVEYKADGSFYVDENMWDKAKGDYCREKKIDIHIDDTLTYAKYFKTPFCLYNQTAEKCNIVGTTTTLNFSQTPDKAIAEIEYYFKDKS